MNLTFLFLIRGMGREVSRRFSCVNPGVRELPINLFVSEVAYLVRVNCLYLIKPMVVGFCWKCNWRVGSCINVLIDFTSEGKKQQLLLWL